VSSGGIACDHKSSSPLSSTGPTSREPFSFIPLASPVRLNETVIHEAASVRVISGTYVADAACPLYPPERTCSLPGIDVCYVPEADILLGI
jgi:hypothetical protein